MSLFLRHKTKLIKTSDPKPAICYHCGDQCDQIILHAEHKFCCEGCKQVYLLLQENNLCNYYDLSTNPGVKAKGKFISERFAYLEDPATIKQLVQFSSTDQTNVTFSLPQMHCSSCIFLLENLHRIEPAITKSLTNFQRKEVFIIFNPQKITLRKVVELLAFIGYEPALSLKDSGEKKTKLYDKQQIYKIGVAGFCFSNIMMLSFPEYFSAGNIEESGLKETFTWIIAALSLPVFFYSGAGFFTSAWKALRQNFLNIDAPIALAILVTFARSYWEIVSGTGAGYLDSGCGIVFFMLVGRWFQDKTYDSLAFDRDYKSYFPLGVSVIQASGEKNIPVTQLKKRDRIIIRNAEMIPADAILVKGIANVDYSFVSGESTPVRKEEGELVYAGGKQAGAAIELEVASEVSQSYITQLWNNDIFQHRKNRPKSFIHPWSRYFTVALFSIALVASVYWAVVDVTRLLPALTAVLIIACPCSLLLSATFTFGNMLRIFGKNKLYLKNAGVIEQLAKVDTIVFDKTGTITQNDASEVSYQGVALSNKVLVAVQALTRQSSHPLSKMIAGSFGASDPAPVAEIIDFKELPGQGIEASVDGIAVKIGAAAFTGTPGGGVPAPAGANVHVRYNNEHMGHYAVTNRYRPGIATAIDALRAAKYELQVLSGDNDFEKNRLNYMFGKGAALLFNQTPQKKLQHVRNLQSSNKTVLMLGDGLNDAGALMQSNVGIAVSDNASRFSPACDAIIDGEKIGSIHQLLAFAKAGKKIVTASFILSIMYNIVGLSFAVQGTLSPVVAAILMPASSISIVLLVTFLSSAQARQLRLN